MQLVNRKFKSIYITHLLFPAFKFFDEEVIPFRDLAKFGIHAPFQINEILPSFQRIPGILIPFSNNLVQVSH